MDDSRETGLEGADLVGAGLADAGLVDNENLFLGWGSDAVYLKAEKISPGGRF